MPNDRDTTINIIIILCMLRLKACPVRLAVQCNDTNLGDKHCLEHQVAMMNLKE
jgi:hypothetical protein